MVSYEEGKEEALASLRQLNQCPVNHNKSIHPRRYLSSQLQIHAKYQRPSLGRYPFSPSKPENAKPKKSTKEEQKKMWEEKKRNRKFVIV